MSRTTFLSPVFCVRQDDNTLRLYQGILEQGDDGSIQKSGDLVDLGNWREVTDEEHESVVIQCDLVKSVTRVSPSGHRTTLKLVPEGLRTVAESNVFDLSETEEQ